MNKKGIDLIFDDGVIVQIGRPFSKNFESIAGVAFAGTGEERGDRNATRCHNRHHPTSMARRRIPVELFSQRLGEPSWQSILSGIHNDVWEDVDVDVSFDQSFGSCDIATSQKTPRNQNRSTRPAQPNSLIFLDILHPPKDGSITPDSTFKFWAFLYDACAKWSMIYTMENGSTQSLIDVLLTHKAQFGAASQYAYVDIGRIRLM